MTAELASLNGTPPSLREMITYDPVGRLLKEMDGLPIGSANTTESWTYSYDLAGQRNSTTDSVTQIPYQEANTYDADGRLATAHFQMYSSVGGSPTTGENLLSVTSYSPFGIAAATLGNNLIRELRTYNNSRGWLYSIAAKTMSNGSSIYSATYGHVANNNVKSLSETMTGNWAQGATSRANTWSYSYDYLNRLQTATSNNDGTFSYTYDRYGNRWHQTGGDLTYLATFNNTHNQVDGASYDASGNLIQDPPGSPVRHNYTYDAENRLTGVTDQGITYTYDAEGRRIGMYTAGALSRTYLRDQDQSSFLVFDGSGNLSSLDLFAAGRHIYHDGYTNGTGSGSYIIADGLGTTKEVTDNVNGWVATICSNLPFGDGQNCENTDQQPFHFTGKERDTESGNDYFGARYYGSSMGRFMSPDWSADPAAIPLWQRGEAAKPKPVWLHHEQPGKLY